MDPIVSQILGVLFFVAMVLMIFELRDTRHPATCPQCAHCAQVIALREREDVELTEEYARAHGLTDHDEHRDI
jgi:hypothetical protein